MTTRHPTAFPVEDTPPGEPLPSTEARRPRAIPATDAAVVIADLDVFEAVDAAPPPAIPARRTTLLTRIFWGAAGALVSLALGLWLDNLVRAMFARAEWLGWVAAGVAALAVVSLVVILFREGLAVARLASVEKLRARGADAVARDDQVLARSVVTELSALMAANPRTAAGRRSLADLKDDIIDGANLVRFAETEVLSPLDARARTMILDAAKRVSVVTAVSPRALVDVAYVLFESARLIRRLSELYGGRPGTLGFFRLARSVLGHLAVTGSMAAGDSLVDQIVGHGLAAKLSTKLGEGVLNGMMTARIGIAAMETARPLPFVALKRPGVRDFFSALTRFSRKEATDERPGEP